MPQRALTRAQLEEMVPFATPAELAAIRVCLEHDTYADAARALGISYDALRARLRECARRVVRKGVTGRELPAGHILDASSVLTDADGKVKAAWDKSKRDADDPAAFETVPEGHHVKRVSTMLGRDGKALVQWIQSEPEKIAQDEARLAALKASVEGYRGLVDPVPAPACTSFDIMNVIHLGDPHIGMLAWGEETGRDFDLKIAEADLVTAMDRLVAGAPSAEVGVLVNLGDFFHGEDDRQVTPGHGHKLDVDSRAGKVARVGLNIVRRLVDRMLQKHTRVEVRNIPGNHDPGSSRWLSLVLETLYERESRVTVHPNHNPYQFAEFGRCMFCWSHTDGAKAAQLPGLMAARQPAMWGRTRYRYAHGGHEHHIQRKEFPGAVFEGHRTLAPGDYYHTHKGYDSGNSISCITYSDRWGEIERKTVDIDLIRHDQGAA